MIRFAPGPAIAIARHAAFLYDMGILVQDRSIDEIKFLLGERDFVFIDAMGMVEGEPCVYINLYRVEREKIAEQWGFPEKTPLKRNGKTTTACLVGTPSHKEPAFAS